MSPEQLKPIGPHEIAELKQQLMPAIVIETINALLAKKAGRGKYIVLTQTEIVEQLVKNGLDRMQIFEDHYLDFEEVYERAGWKVTYDRPGYNESYEPTFTFSSASRR